MNANELVTNYIAAWNRATGHAGFTYQGDLGL